MIEIIKGKEPDCLKQLREQCKKEKLNPKESYDRLRGKDKDEVRDCLRREQGCLCAYCMRRIPIDLKDRAPGSDSESIEHYIPLHLDNEADLGQGLDYQNMFMVCNGNKTIHEKNTRRNKTKNTLTCDKSRGNKMFKKVNPLKRETLESIEYTLDGIIYSTDPDVDFDLNDLLNLNCEPCQLKENRKKALDGLIEEINVQDDMIGFCKEVLKEYENESGEKTPFVGILIWYLKTMID